MTDTTEHVRFGHFASFPLYPMIYQIKLQYGFIVEATNSDTLRIGICVVLEELEKVPLNLWQLPSSEQTIGKKLHCR